MDSILSSTTAARDVPAALVLDVFGSCFDEIEAVLIDAVVDGRLDPVVARGLLYATVETAEVAPC